MINSKLRNSDSIYSMNWINFVERKSFSSIPPRNCEMEIEPLLCPYLVNRLRSKYPNLKILQKFVTKPILVSDKWIQHTEKTPKQVIKSLTTFMKSKS